MSVASVLKLRVGVVATWRRLLHEEVFDLLDAYWTIHSSGPSITCTAYKPDRNGPNTSLFYLFRRLLFAAVVVVFDVDGVRSPLICCCRDFCAASSAPNPANSSINQSIVLHRSASVPRRQGDPTACQPTLTDPSQALPLCATNVLASHPSGRQHRNILVLKLLYF